MKILWLVNVKLPIIYRALGQNNKTIVAGWLDQISEKILDKKEMELVICYPTENINGEVGKDNNLTYHGLFFENKKLLKGLLEENKYITVLVDLLKLENPDIIHVHGTEFQYSYFMTRAAKQAGMIDRLAISIQGLVKFYAKHYLFELPKAIIHGKTIKELLLREGVYSGYKSYLCRGEYEEKALQMVNYIIGRTNWDKGCAYIINPDAEYMAANETLRSNFYTSSWHYLSCVPHSIFISQASYPIKGFHLSLNAFAIVKKSYPDLKIRVAGFDLSKDNWFRGSKYALYVQKLIKQYDLSDNIQFIGFQTADQMKQEMLKANIFVSSSTIENSPNSVGEGMILGMPCIASDVGGVANLMIHNEEGYVYPLNETYMLAYYIMDIFANPEKSAEMGEKARKHALITHDVHKNLVELLKIYDHIQSRCV